MSDQMKAGYLNRPLICIQQIFDPDSPDPECREYNFLASVQVNGNIGERFFLELHEAMEWTYDKVLELQARTDQNQ